ncbi:MAG: aminotransferase class I/II-fold pyridoxal phosphate-dependent enzyme [Candidatus Latescibacteria bacterium]|jgi:cystathionine beta-lyase/cystathionine gamma-synthase|nr:aminotransferase class I/II-fold pyridoxal phosphate-dependent enzyme [Candidatus Latescibacterota bacterium]MBT4139700.1 aminotransferase class I/II-fold pyridoxal phosphate-dependent enzyme [Candidatus Latescibacterota bacterium]MBT5830744.1 aminotransferase class I/II-fold pyridoxal phosphate-dependent enzyme [Candidatus Latescibacterota bacterium]
MGKMATDAIHAGEIETRPSGAVVLPIFQSATFEYGGQDDYHDLKYIRLNNTPNHQVLHDKLAILEGGEAALVTASGMAAITTLLLTVLKQGDHLLAQDCLYGGTVTFLTQDIADYGIGVGFFAGNDPDSWEALLRPETRAIYVEPMTNPLLEVADLDAVVAFAKKHNLLAIIDNTFASPVNFQPLKIGFDVVVHSCTKYLNGHSDIVAGGIVGTRELITRVTHRLNHLGASLDPHACFLLHRGIKTLVLRVKQQNENALSLATFLNKHPKVEAVYYPGIEDHPQYTRASRLFDGCGGVLSFEVKGSADDADRLMSRLKLSVVAPSLGGVETLITRPVQTSHAGLSREQRKAAGISDKLIRVAVGIEDGEDICADFEQALSD